MAAPPRPNLYFTLPEVMTVREVARLFRMSASTMHRHDGVLKPFRTPGGQRRYHRHVVAGAYEARVQERTS